MTRAKQTILSGLVILFALAIAAAGSDASSENPLSLFAPEIGTLFEVSRDPGDTRLIFSGFLDLPDAGSGEDSIVRLTTLCDSAPGVLTGNSVSAVYGSILQFGEMPVFQQSSQQAKQENASLRVLERRRGGWLRLLGGHSETMPSAKLLAYQRYAEERARVLDEIAAQGENEERLSRLDAANQRWTVLGHRKEVEAALQRFNEATMSDPAAWWQVTRELYESRGGPNAEVQVDPPLASWPGEEGWIRFQGSKQLPGGQLAEARLEVKRVHIVRPWLDRAVFHSRRWWWTLGSPFDSGLAVAAGEGSPKMAPLLPCLPTGLILGRKGEIAVAGTRMGFDSPLIVGWLCESLPRSPAPEPGLLWATRWH